MAKNNQPASAYAGRYVEGMEGSVTEKGNCLNEANISVGAISKGNQMGDKVNPYGTGTMRGYGAATKGKKISGKMG